LLGAETSCNHFIPSKIVQQQVTIISPQTTGAGTPEQR